MSAKTFNISAFHPCMLLVEDIAVNLVYANHENDI